MWYKEVELSEVTRLITGRPVWLTPTPRSSPPWKVDTHLRSLGCKMALTLRGCSVLTSLEELLLCSLNPVKTHVWPILIIWRLRMWEFAYWPKSILGALLWSFVDMCRMMKNFSLLILPAEAQHSNALLSFFGSSWCCWQDLFSATLFTCLCFSLVILLLKMSPPCPV